jgi:polysaccharide biosynthesis transport protein
VRGLAASLSGLERRVLIVEDAGRRPVESPASEQGDPSDQGVASEAAQEQITATGLTRYHRASGNLSEIFGCQDRFQPWIEKAGVHFDVVIVEAPAVMTDVEALLMARAADLVLFAVRWRSTPRQAAAAAFQQLIPARGQAAMGVITEVDLAAHRKLGQRDSLYFSRRYADAARLPV